jgi:hypothetical protein
MITMTPNDNEGDYRATVAVLLRSRGPWLVVLRSKLGDKTKPEGRQENGVIVLRLCLGQTAADAAAPMVTAQWPR